MPLCDTVNIHPVASISSWRYARSGDLIVIASCKPYCKRIFVLADQPDIEIRVRKGTRIKFQVGSRVVATTRDVPPMRGIIRGRVVRIHKQRTWIFGKRVRRTILQFASSRVFLNLVRTGPIATVERVPVWRR